MTRYRKLKDGTEVEELDKPKELRVFTKCPEKYMLVDMETGEKYIGYKTDGPSSWKKVQSNA